MKKTIRDLDLRNKRTLIRVDFNVPLDKDLKITDDNRIRASLPTIQYALEHGAKVVLMSHLGRPEGKPVSSMSLSPAAKRLSELLKTEVLQCSDNTGPRVKEELKRLDGGCQVALLENLRFSPGEEKNDPAFARALAENGEVFVNDAFGSSHRAHASIEGITKYLPSGAGFLLEKEIQYLGDAIQHPQKPFVAILGGSKVSDKIGVVENLIDKVDRILIGGAMAYTFMKVKGLSIGKSRFEKDKLELAKQILEKAAAKKVQLLLPVDNYAVERFSETAPSRIVENGIPEGWEGVDIGPKTAQLFRNALDDAKTVVWNGPMGVFEMKPFAGGSLAVAEKVAEITAKGAVTVIGGGDTAACVIGFGLEDKVTHVSTGGGASLEYLEGRVLPGIAALEDK
jgi:3-phosphoglycerate kinase